MKRAMLLGIVGIFAIVSASAMAAPVMVTVTGEVEFNQINTPPLGDVTPGLIATMTFVVDSDDFDDSMNFPTRGYVIQQPSFSLTFDGIELDLQDPFPAGETPYFVIRDNDPAVDGFFVSTNLDVPFGFGLPLNQTGIFGQFQDSFRVTYEGDTLPSLDILDALGTYDFTGLTVFGWSMDDGPFEAMFIIFSQMTLEAVPVDDDGDGILNDDDLCAGTVTPESAPTVRLGTNRWALVDDDNVFDTNPPNGVGPGFMFDLEDTGGCSCEQIVAMRGLGKGHMKFGCSNSVMMEWSAMVAGADYSVVGDVQIGQPEPSPTTAVSTDGIVDLQFSKATRTREDRVNRAHGTIRSADRLAGNN